jgi:hypothetical protein
MKLNQREGKNPRAAIEGTIREVKHPFPAGKLPVRGLFRMTCVMVSSAAMTNIRRIHHYLEDKRKLARQLIAAEGDSRAASQQQSDSFSSLLGWLLVGPESPRALSNA